ncbi:MAG: diacylglycerol kinase [Opitutales bacterium]|nr:diacylglycerol kinase [Opitutales bacterium]
MQKNKGIVRLFRAFKYSIAGFAAALKNEAAFRQEIALGVPLCVLAAFLDVPPLGKCALICSIFAVWIVELINSAIEECVNLASPGMHPYAKRAKDMASAAVFLAIASAIIVWTAVLLPDYF